MKISGECANLELDTGTITGASGLTYDLSLISFDVNFRQVLGPMYDKYDKFLIVFNSYCAWTNSTTWSTSTGVSALTTTAGWSLGMSGLDWESNSYNGQLSTIAYFPNKITLPTNGYTFFNSPSFGNGIIFRKPSSFITSLKVVPYSVRANGSAVSVVTAGTPTFDFNYNFSIYGLSDE